jgi:hypothetical protein
VITLYYLGRPIPDVETEYGCSDHPHAEECEKQHNDVACEEGKLFLE